MGQFGGHSWENVKAFVERVNNEKIVTAISSWECAKIVADSLLIDEAALEYQKMVRNKDKFPNHDYWPG